MTKRTLYYTYEFGCGVTIADSKNIELNGLTIKNCIGDCICTIAPPLNVTVDNLKIINCTLENSRRQGISFVATGENYLVKNCNIGKINGIDPQSGIDFEHYDYVRSVIIDNCNFYDNKKLDIINYNGNNIEIKNSTFNGVIGSTFGWNMDIHDNIFSCKSSGGSALNLGTNKNDNTDAYFKIYNNIFKNYTAGGNTSSLMNSIFDNNTLYSCNNFSISCKGSSNKFYNSLIWYVNNDNFTLISNCQYENSTINVSNNLPAIEFNNCIFNDTSLQGRGKTSVNKCIFNMNSKPIIDGWKPSGTELLYQNCTINSIYTKNIQLLGSSVAAKSTFDNCIFNISRYTLALSYSTLIFNNYNFIFNDLNTDKNSIDLNRSGYGYEKCPWYFNNCHFKSNLPIKIYGGNVVSPIIEGNIIII